MNRYREAYLRQVSRAYNVPRRLIANPTGRRRQQKIRLWMLEDGYRLTRQGWRWLEEMAR